MQEKLHIETIINAPVKKVWEIMLGQETYKQWTSAFEPTSYYEGNWEKGSKMKFLGSDGSGLVAEVAENIPGEFLSIMHLGMVQKGVEDTTSEEVKKWTPAFENYTFISHGEKTELKVDMEMKQSDMSKMMKEMFEGAWPKALEKLKELCEK